jgi:hypothetical protein
MNLLGLVLRNTPHPPPKKTDSYPPIVTQDGAVHIRYVSISKVGIPVSAREEVERSITGKGTVTRCLRDGSTEIYLANGEAPFLTHR